MTAVAFGGAGALLLLIGWIVISGQSGFSAQLPYLNLAVGGALLAAAGNALYLVQFRRAVRERLEVLAGGRSAAER
jgi:drug/metabolite transporter (DMT)-like permease